MIQKEGGTCGFHFVYHTAYIFFRVHAEHPVSVFNHCGLSTHLYGYGSKFHGDDSAADEGDTCGENVQIQKISAVVDIFLTRNILLHGMLTGADHNVLSGNLSAIDINGMRIHEFSVSVNDRHMRVLEHTFHNFIQRRNYFLLVVHQTRPVRLRKLGNTDALIPLQAVQIIEGRVKKNLGIASVVGAGSSDHISLYESHLLACLKQNHCCMPARMAGSDKYHIIIVHVLSS